MTQGIYRILNTANGKSYVGSAIHIENRWCVHRHGLARGAHHSVKLQRAWAKHGADAFAFSILEPVQATEDLPAREQAWIDSLMSAGAGGYNVYPTARGTRNGHEISEETRAKMRAAKLGMVRTMESRKKQSEAARGKKRTPEHCRNISQGQKGRQCSESTRLAVAAANRLRVHSPETRAKLSAASKKGNAIRWGTTSRSGHLNAWGDDRDVVWTEPLEETQEQI